MGPYALFQADRHGAGIRPRPYSRDMAIQPFTYDSIKTGGWLNGTSLALPHGLGHGWAAVLWDLDWDLIDKYGFNPNLYGAWNTGGNIRALQYVTDGLKLQGCGPGLVVARGAIIAAAERAERRRGHVHRCGRRSPAAGSASAPCRGRRAATTTRRRSTRIPDCLRGVRRRHRRPGPTLNAVNPGAPRPMTFTPRRQPGAGHPRRATRRTRGWSTATR